MSDIEKVIERGRQRYGLGEFDAAAQVVMDSIRDEGTKAQFIAAVARNDDGEGVVYRRANEIRSKAIGKEGPKTDAREQRIASINVRSPMYDTMSDSDWNAAWDRTHGAKAKKRR
jgi:hypothetical protein